MSWLKDPGYLKKPRTLDLQQVLREYPAFKVCPVCEIPKPKRSKHCDYCNKCVKVFDHHCPWINNCVGARNHGSFLIFIISMTVLCLAALGINFPVMIRGTR